MSVKGDGSWTFGTDYFIDCEDVMMSVILIKSKSSAYFIAKSIQFTETIYMNISFSCQIAASFIIVKSTVDDSIIDILNSFIPLNLNKQTKIRWFINFGIC